MAHVPLIGDLVGRLEDALRRLRHAGDPVQRAVLEHLLHQGLGIEALFPGEPVEDLVHEGEHALAVGLLHPMLEGQGEDRLDARGAGRDHRDRPGGSDRRDRGVAHGAPVLVDGARPVGERPALLGEPGRLIVGLFLDEGHDLLGQVQRLRAVVGDAHDEEEVRPAHDPQADPPVGLDGGVDHGQRVRVHLDDVVEEPDGQAHHALEILPVDGPLAVVGPPGELGDVEATQIAVVDDHSLSDQRMGHRLRDVVDLDLLVRNHGCDLDCETILLGSLPGEPVAAFLLLGCQREADEVEEAVVAFAVDLELAPGPARRAMRIILDVASHPEVQQEQLNLSQQLQRCRSQGDLRLAVRLGPVGAEEPLEVTDLLLFQRGEEKLRRPLRGTARRRESVGFECGDGRGPISCDAANHSGLRLDSG